MRKKHFVFLFITLLSVNSIFADSGKTINIAIIADKASGVDKSALVSLLEVELSQKESIQLLERAAIDKILDEQQLSAAGLLDRNNAIKIGKLLRADAFIILSMENPAPEQNRVNQTQDANDLIRVRVSETAHGLRLADFFEQSDKTNPQEAIERIIKKIETVINKISQPDEKLIPVGIVDIHRVQLGEQYKMLERTLPTMLSVRLSLEPQIIMLEREDLKVLLDEKLRTEGEDSKFWNSAILIEGYLQPNDGRLEMHLNLNQADGESKKSLIVQVEPNEPYIAIAKATTEIIQNLQNSPPTAKWQPELEAVEFYKQGKMLEAHSRNEEALPLYETAHALQPENVYYTGAIFKRIWDIRRKIESVLKENEYYRRMREERIKNNPQKQIEPLELDEPETCPYSDMEIAELVSILVRQIRDEYESGLFSAHEIFYKWSEFLGREIILDSGYFSKPASVSTEQIRHINRVNRKIWFETFSAALKNQFIRNDYPPMNYYIAARLAWISSDDPNELIKNIKNTFTEFVMPIELGGHIKSASIRQLVYEQAFIVNLEVFSPEYLNRHTYLKGSGDIFVKLYKEYIEELVDLNDDVVSDISKNILLKILINNTDGVQTDGSIYETTKLLLEKLKYFDNSQDNKTKQTLLAQIKSAISPIKLERDRLEQYISIWGGMCNILIEQNDIYNLMLLNPGKEPFHLPPFPNNANEANALISYYYLLDQVEELFEKQKGDMQAIIAINCIKDFQSEIRKYYGRYNKELDIPKTEINQNVTMLLTKEDWKQPIISSGYEIPLIFQNEMLWVVLVSKESYILNGEIYYKTDIGLAGINLEQRKLTTMQQVKILTPNNVKNPICSITYNDKIILSLFGAGIIEFPISIVSGQKHLDIPKVYDQKNGLLSLSNTSIAKADNDKIWVAYGGFYEESGLGLYNPKNEQWETIFCSTIKDNTPLNNGQTYQINSIRYIDPDILYLAISDPNKPWESSLYKMNINTKEAQYVNSIESELNDEQAVSMGLKRKSSRNIMEEMSLTDSNFVELTKGPLNQGYLALSFDGVGVYKNKLWARMGQSQILIIEKGKSFEDAQIIDNNILNGEPVVRFVSTSYGLIAIGNRTVGLIETEN
jgi:hypothetical protein